jgi:hypothetical protein
MIDASPLLDLVQQHASYYAAAVAFEPGSANASAHHKAADEVLARIAALVPQQPVQARSRRGRLMWQHGCGAIDECEFRPSPDHCPSGPWRPLLVAAPDGDRTPAPKPDLMAQVMAELDLTDPADVLVTIAKRAAALKRVCRSADLRKEQRDEARAEVERLKRDYVIGKTWREQREACLAEQRAAQPDPMVLRLPEVPEGATLVGLATGYRWAQHPLGGWVCPDRGPISLGRLLQSAEPKGVRVELAEALYRESGLAKASDASLD